MALPVLSTGTSMASDEAWHWLAAQGLACPPTLAIYSFRSKVSCSSGLAEIGMSSICVACLDEDTARCIAVQCGHLVYCTSCCRKKVLQHLEVAKPRWSKKMRLKQMHEARIPCPICRGETAFILLDKFQGRVIRP